MIINLTKNIIGNLLFYLFPNPSEIDVACNIYF